MKPTLLLIALCAACSLVAGDGRQASLDDLAGVQCSSLISRDSTGQFGVENRVTVIKALPGMIWYSYSNNYGETYEKVVSGDYILIVKFERSQKDTSDNSRKKR